MIRKPTFEMHRNVKASQEYPVKREKLNLLQVGRTTDVVKGEESIVNSVEPKPGHHLKEDRSLRFPVLKSNESTKVLQSEKVPKRTLETLRPSA
jgi:hypothetical protein